MINITALIRFIASSLAFLAMTIACAGGITGQVTNYPPAHTQAIDIEEIANWDLSYSVLMLG